METINVSLLKNKTWPKGIPEVHVYQPRIV
jgi:hypothetical protein